MITSTMARKVSLTSGFVAFSSILLRAAVALRRAFSRYWWRFTSVLKYKEVVESACVSEFKLRGLSP